jgi:hypothetical protein
MRRVKHTTYTNQVYVHLISSGTLLTTSEIRSQLPHAKNQISAALSNLRKCKAVDIIEEDGIRYWYATPENDTRSREILEVVEGITRKRKPKPCKPSSPTPTSPSPPAASIIAASASSESKPTNSFKLSFTEADGRITLRLECGEDTPWRWQPTDSPAVTSGRGGTIEITLG